MEFTGERFIPGSAPWDMEFEHSSRYTACAGIVSGKRVLDAACGSGYGTSFLATQARSAVGVDVDPAAVEYAKSRYPGDNLDFVTASITALPFADTEFDVITSFETLEHVDASAQDSFLREAKRVLGPQGVLVISTPDKAQATDVAGVDNHFHVCELYEDEFLEKLHRQFTNVSLYYQNLWIYAEVLEPRRPSGPIDVGLDMPVTHGQNMIAVCSDGRVPDLTSLLRSPMGHRAEERDRTARLVAHYEQTLSWKLTAPLRKIRSAFR